MCQPIPVVKRGGQDRVDTVPDDDAGSVLLIPKAVGVQVAGEGEAVVRDAKRIEDR